jgi:hypothetical protein
MENATINNGTLQKNIYLSSLARGIYLVRILADGKTYIGKLIYAQ